VHFTVDALTEERDSAVSQTAATERVLNSEVEGLKEKVSKEGEVNQALKDSIGELEAEKAKQQAKLSEAQSALAAAQAEASELRSELDKKGSEFADERSWQVKKLQIAAEEDEALVATLLKMSAQMVTLLQSESQPISS